MDKRITFKHIININETWIDQHLNFRPNVEEPVTILTDVCGYIDPNQSENGINKIGSSSFLNYPYAIRFRDYGPTYLLSEEQKDIIVEYIDKTCGIEIIYEEYNPGSNGGIKKS